MSGVRALALLFWLLPIPVMAESPDLNRRLVLAAERGDTAEVRRLIGAGADVNWQDEKQDSAFLVAGARGHSDRRQPRESAGLDRAPGGCDPGRRRCDAHGNRASTARARRESERRRPGR